MVYKVGINCAIIGVLGVTGLATIFSVSPMTSFLGSNRRLDGLLSLMAYLFLFYMIVMCVRKKDIDKFIFVFIGIAVVTSIYGLCQKYRLDPLEGLLSIHKSAPLFFVDRPGSTFGNPAFFSAFLGVVVPLIVYAIIKYRQWWMCLVLGIVLYAMILTQTRSAFIGLLVAMVYFVIQSRYYAIFKLILIVLVFIAILSVLVPDSPAKRIVNITGNAPRLQIYNVGWELIKDRPWLGYGPDCLGFVYDNYHASLYGSMSYQTRLHNEELDIIVDTGIIGLVAWVFFYVQYFRLAWKGRHNMITVALSSSVLGYLVQNQFSFGMMPNILTFWFLIALTVVSTGREK